MTFGLRGLLAACAVALALGAQPVGSQSVGAQSVAGDDRAVFAAAAEALRARDHSTAFDLFEVLAEKDLPEAQYILSALLWEGRGRTRNYREALYWALLARLETLVAVDALTLAIKGDQESLLAAKRALEENGQIGRSAEMMVARLDPLVLPEQRAAVVDRIAARIEAQIAEGRREAVMKFGILNAELRAEPDLEAAYVWFSVGRAIGVIGAQDRLDKVADALEPEALLAAQDKAVAVFEASAFARAPAAAAPAEPTAEAPAAPPAPAP
jgi:TPR repeat protein